MRPGRPGDETITPWGETVGINAGKDVGGWIDSVRVRGTPGGCDGTSPGRGVEGREDADDEEGGG